MNIFGVFCVLPEIFRGIDLAKEFEVEIEVDMLKAALGFLRSFVAFIFEELIVLLPLSCCDEIQMQHNLKLR